VTNGLSRIDVVKFQRTIASDKDIIACVVITDYLFLRKERKIRADMSLPE
jgi:hypothetical protein